MTLSRRSLRPVSWVVLAAVLSACGGTERRTDTPTLALIAPVSIPESSNALPATEIDAVVAQYHAVLEVANDPEIRVRVQRRLAGLEMLRSEQRQIDGGQQQRYFDEAIVLYQALLDAHPDRKDNDHLLYQMAKALELDGRLEDSAIVLARLARDYPQSRYYAEARFRHGELLFSEQRYREAEQAYAAVQQRGQQSAYFDNAVYMHGWSLFKQARYRDSLDAFTGVLDRSLQRRAELSGLPPSELEMVQDTLRAMALAFSHLDGGAGIVDYYAQQGERPWLHLLYRQLGGLYLEKERFRDSADTFQRFVSRYPLTAQAPEFSVSLIDVYRQGGFPSEILPAKEEFVGRYGLTSDYWVAADESLRVSLRHYLHEYLPELAAHYHGLAQLQAADSRRAKPAEIRQGYLAAARWYGEFAATFPDDSATPAMVFLMAESLNEAGQTAEAITAYEHVAYDYRDPEKGGEAGYSAILGYEKLAAGSEDDDWQLQKIESALRFAETYPGDPRALPVLTRAAEELLASGSPGQAVAAGARVTAWQPAAGPGLQRTAWLVQGHGHFELASYGEAERAYRNALQLMNAEDTARDSTGDRLAASIYKQAEAHLAAGEPSQAVDDFLRVSSVAPGTEIAIKAHYDGASLLTGMESWERAQQAWQDFRRHHATHPLAVDVSARLSHIYQQQGHWRQAADELTHIATDDQDPDVRRQSLYMAAELYEKAGAAVLAIARYREYVERWPSPFNLATEARYRLTVLYEEQGDAGQRREWLIALMSDHDRAGSFQTGRSRYLAAMAAAVLAEDAYRDFHAAPLTLPLKRSLKTKQTLMQASLKASERVLDYGVAEFVTEASFRIGDVYAGLGQDLMDSDRPAGFNALELEQYELLLEEQAWPFEEKAIAIHETNARRSWSGVYDDWVRRSLDALAGMLPARYGKSEKLVRVSHDIY